MRRTVLALLTVAGSVAAQAATPPSVSPGTVTPPSADSGSVTTSPMMPPPMVTSPGVTPPSIATTPPASSGGVGTTGEAQARARIERDGFTNVTGLSKSADGTGSGTAMRGSTSVQVTVDARGNVNGQ